MFIELAGIGGGKKRRVQNCHLLNATQRPLHHIAAIAHKADPAAFGDVRHGIEPHRKFIGQRFGGCCI